MADSFTFSLMHFILNVILYNKLNESRNHTNNSIMLLALYKRATGLLRIIIAWAADNFACYPMRFLPTVVFYNKLSESRNYLNSSI